MDLQRTFENAINSNIVTSHIEMNKGHEFYNEPKNIVELRFNSEIEWAFKKNKGNIGQCNKSKISRMK